MLRIGPLMFLGSGFSPDRVIHVFSGTFPLLTGLTTYKYLQRIRKVGRHRPTDFEENLFTNDRNGERI